MKEQTKTRIKGAIMLPVVILLGVTILPLAVILSSVFRSPNLADKIVYPLERILFFIFGDTDDKTPAYDEDE